MARDAKPRYELLPLHGLEEVVRALGFGAEKHVNTVPTWREGDPHDHFASVMRHVIAWQLGEMNDQESGLHHLSHAVARLLMCIEVECTGDKIK